MNCILVISLSAAFVGSLNALECYHCVGTSTDDACSTGGTTLEDEATAAMKLDCSSPANACYVLESSGIKTRSCTTQAICDETSSWECCTSDLCNSASIGLYNGAVMAAFLIISLLAKRLL